MKQTIIATNEIETLMIRRNFVYSSPFTVTYFPPNMFDIIGAIPLKNWQTLAIKFCCFDGVTSDARTLDDDWITLTDINANMIETMKMTLFDKRIKALKK